MRVAVPVAGYHPGNTSDYVVAALQQVLVQFPDVWLMLIGSGPCETALRRRAKELNLKKNLL